MFQAPNVYQYQLTTPTLVANSTVLINNTDQSITGNISANVITANTNFSGSGSGLTTNTIPRIALSNGTALQFIYNDTNGVISSTASLTLNNNKLIANPSSGVNIQTNLTLGTNSKSIIESTNLTTTAATETLLKTFTLELGDVLQVDYYVTASNTTDSKASIYSGKLFIQQYNAIASNPPTYTVFNQFSSLQSGNTDSLTFVATNGILSLNCNGMSSKNYSWSIMTNITKI